jgi:hypothetical protein
MNVLVLNSHRGDGASRALATAAILLVGLASLATLDTAAAGKGGDNRAPKAAFSGGTQTQIDHARGVRPFRRPKEKTD